MAARFIGQSKNRLDDKDRVFVPGSLRKAIEAAWGKEPRLVTHLNPVGTCIVLASEEGWLEAWERYNQMEWHDEYAAQMRRLQSLSEIVRMDRQGRITVPPFLREYVGIQDEILFVGCGDYIELWNPEAGRKILQDTFASAKDLISKVRGRPGVSGGGTGGVPPSGGGV